MKLAIFSHCVLDTIKLNDSSYPQVGGPACYGSLTARNLKLAASTGHREPDF